MGDDFLCSINLPRLSLADQEIARFIESSLDAHGIPGQSVCFEISEAAPLGMRTIAEVVPSGEVIRAPRESVSITGRGSG